MYQAMNLSHAEALLMVAAVQKKAESEKKACAVAVADSHGELLAFLRMDGCRLPSIYIAMNKAFTAAREEKPSGEVGESSRRTPYPMTNFGTLRYTAWAGGFPVIHQGKVVGAIGVSGLTEAEDADLARHALEAAK
jgi:glc operon protein GlcG